MTDPRHSGPGEWSDRWKARLRRRRSLIPPSARSNGDTPQLVCAKPPSRLWRAVVYTLILEAILVGVLILAFTLF